MMAPDECEPPLAFEIWAQVSARSLKRDPEERARLLDGYGIDDEHWSAADAYWTAAIVDDLGRGDHARPQQYGLWCAEELRSRRAQQVPFVGSTSDASTAPVDAEDVSQTVSLDDAGGSAVTPMQQTMDAVPLRGPVMPFRPGPVEAVVDRLPRTPPSDCRAPTDTLTPALPRLRPAALPFATESVLPELTVEQFAAMNAEAQARPERETETLHRFGVSGRHARQHLEQRWAARFAADPALQQRYRSVLAACASWLERPCGR